MTTLLEGDCRVWMAEMLGDSVDAVVTDPPYGLEFMGKEWDRPCGHEAWAAAVLRVLKPGGHLVAFGGTRTHHRLWCALEDVGFEIRDTLCWLYGSGFPKGKACLKPAWEPIVLARKPLVGTVAANVQAHGTGALNVDGCRVGTGDRPLIENAGRAGKIYGAGKEGSRAIGKTSAGRWPANVVLDEDAAAMLDAQSGERVGFKGQRDLQETPSHYFGADKHPGIREGFNDSGGASRFFYCAKASRAERGKGNNHPTVKPLTLMRWLTRLVTPPNGLILDPFVGSGTTALAAQAEGFRCTGIDSNGEYLAIARQRLADSATR